MIVPTTRRRSQPDEGRAWLAAVTAAGLRRTSPSSTSAPTTARARRARSRAARSYRAARRRVHRPLPAGAHLHGLERGQPRLPADRHAARGRRRLLPGARSRLPDVHDRRRRRARLRLLRPAGCGASSAWPATELWGLHNYSDVTYGTTAGTDNVLAAVPGTLWVEETGGIVVRRDAAGRILLAADEARAARAVTNAFALPASGRGSRACTSTSGAPGRPTCSTRACCGPTAASGRATPRSSRHARAARAGRRLARHDVARVVVAGRLDPARHVRGDAVPRARSRSPAQRAHVQDGAAHDEDGRHAPLHDRDAALHGLGQGAPDVRRAARRRVALTVRSTAPVAATQTRRAQAPSSRSSQ